LALLVFCSWDLYAKDCGDSAGWLFTLLLLLGEPRKRSSASSRSLPSLVAYSRNLDLVIPTWPSKRIELPPVHILLEPTFLSVHVRRSRPSILVLLSPRDLTLSSDPFSLSLSPFNTSSLFLIAFSALSALLSFSSVYFIKGRLTYGGSLVVGARPPSSGELLPFRVRPRADRPPLPSPSLPLEKKTASFSPFFLSSAFPCRSLQCKSRIAL